MLFCSAAFLSLAISAFAAPNDCQQVAVELEGHLRGDASFHTGLDAAAEVFQNVIQGRVDELRTTWQCPPLIAAAPAAFRDMPSGYQSHPTCQALRAWKAITQIACKPISCLVATAQALDKLASVDQLLSLRPHAPPVSGSPVFRMTEADANAICDTTSIDCLTEVLTPLVKAHKDGANFLTPFGKLSAQAASRQAAANRPVAALVANMSSTTPSRTIGSSALRSLLSRMCTVDPDTGVPCVKAAWRALQSSKELLSMIHQASTTWSPFREPFAPEHFVMGLNTSELAQTTRSDAPGWKMCQACARVALLPVVSIVGVAATVSRASHTAGHLESALGCSSTAAGVLVCSEAHRFRLPSPLVVAEAIDAMYRGEACHTALPDASSVALGGRVSYCSEVPTKELIGSTADSLYGMVGLIEGQLDWLRPRLAQIGLSVPSADQLAEAGYGNFSIAAGDAALHGRASVGVCAEYAARFAAMWMAASYTNRPTQPSDAEYLVAGVCPTSCAVPATKLLIEGKCCGAAAAMIGSVLQADLAKPIPVRISDIVQGTENAFHVCVVSSANLLGADSAAAVSPPLVSAASASRLAEGHTILHAADIPFSVPNPTPMPAWVDREATIPASSIPSLHDSMPVLEADTQRIKGVLSDGTFEIGYLIDSGCPAHRRPRWRTAIQFPQLNTAFFQARSFEISAAVQSDVARAHSLFDSMVNVTSVDVHRSLLVLEVFVESLVAARNLGRLFDQAVISGQASNWVVNTLDVARKWTSDPWVTGTNALTRLPLDVQPVSGYQSIAVMDGLPATPGPTPPVTPGAVLLGLTLIELILVGVGCAVGLIAILLCLSVCCIRAERAGRPCCGIKWCNACGVEPKTSRIYEADSTGSRVTSAGGELRDADGSISQSLQPASTDKRRFAASGAGFGEDDQSTPSSAGNASSSVVHMWQTTPRPTITLATVDDDTGGQTAEASDRPSSSRFGEFEDGKQPSRTAWPEQHYADTQDSRLAPAWTANRSAAPPRTAAAAAAAASGVDSSSAHKYFGDSHSPSAHTQQFTTLSGPAQRGFIFAGGDAHAEGTPAATRAYADRVARKNAEVDRHMADW